MARMLRKAGAAAVLWLASGGAAATLAIDADGDSAYWAEAPLPASVVAESPVMRDSAIRTTSELEPIADDGSLAKADTSGVCDACNACNLDACGCQPKWYVSAGAVILHRDRPNAAPIVVTNPGGANTFSSASDFDFGWNGGLDLTIARRTCRGNIWEARYFGVDGVGESQFVSPGAFIGAGFTGPGGTNFAARYVSKLDSAELNWRHPTTERLTVLAGFRWLELSDDLHYRINNTVAEGRYNYNNHLYGGQLGADLALTDRCNPWQVNVVGKAGYFANVADGGIQEFSGGNPIGGFATGDTVSAFVGEVGVSAAYRLTERIAIRGGYQLLWINDVALAGDNASRSLFNPSLLAGSVGATGDVFYHGATAAIDFAW